MFPVGTLSMAVTSDVEPEETATHIQRDRGLYFEDIILPNETCSATKHDQTLFGDLTGCYVLSGQTLLNMFDHQPNEENVL